MFGKTCVYITIVFAFAFLLGQQEASQAQTKVTAVVGWVGNNNVPTLWPNVQGSVSGTKTGGSFYVSGLLTSTSIWSVGGSCHSITFSSDANGQRSCVTGWVYYTGGTLQSVPAVATLTITQTPDGKASVGIKVVSWFGATLLTSTGLDVNLAPLELSLIKGSAKIVP